MKSEMFTISVEMVSIHTSIPKFLCLFFSDEVQNDTKPTEEISRHRRVANGFPTDRYQFPYIVSIQGGQGSHGCAGSIISEKFVLTAGHCASRPRASSMVVMVGEPFQYDYPNQYYPVEDVFRHESYGLPDDLADAINDISLIKLKEPIKFSRIAQKVKLIRRDQYVVIGANAVALGWGAVREPRNHEDYKYNHATETEENPLVFDISRFDNGSYTYARVFPKYLQRLNTKIISRYECLRRYKDPVHESHMCTFSRGRGLCFKDSGGPLIVDGIQVGIFSGFKRCGTYPGYPSLFTNITLFRDWIDSKMRGSVRYRGEIKPLSKIVTNN
ncbi:hypothetical protein QAD02_006298 [Eretmocerus hayati]|uniref:Uncharacterized protein n=1 Tax=Eretmocerus hayati TaxID=131215 RepID=A0ACC2N1B8_9HYME|nr:hypothetical protein QAD02_006298 [Eretmocerus hayati]